MASKSNVAQLKAQEEQRRLSKEQLLQPRLITQEVEIESLGGSVVLKSLTHAERQEVRQRAGFGTDSWDEDMFTMLSIVKSVAEPELTEDDIKALNDQNSAVIDELITQITFLNMMGQAADLKKGSSETKN